MRLPKVQQLDHPIQQPLGIAPNHHGSVKAPSTDKTHK